MDSELTAVAAVAVMSGATAHCRGGLYDDTEDRDSGSDEDSLQTFLRERFTVAGNTGRNQRKNICSLRATSKSRK